MFNTVIFRLPCLGLFAVWGLRNPILTYCLNCFQGFKILKYLQNTPCMSFALFTHYIYSFSINFYGRNVFKYQASFSSLSKSFCVSTILEPSHRVPKYRDMWPVTKLRHIFICVYLMKKKLIWNCSLFHKLLNKDSTIINDLLFIYKIILNK